MACPGQGPTCLAFACRSRWRCQGFGRPAQVVRFRFIRQFVRTGRRDCRAWLYDAVRGSTDMGERRSQS